MKINCISDRGLTMPEVLGAAAVLLTVATIATLSVRDTVSAGSQATMQRELQQLNTALNNYEAAGGVTPTSSGDSDTLVEAVLDSLKDGVGLAGESGEFAALVTDPNLAVALDGETYNLEYTPGVGFTYEPASGTGDAITGGGVLGAASGTYPFDITNRERVNEALQYFRALNPADPVRQSYVDAFNAVRNLGTLSEEEIDSLGRQLGEADVYDINKVWAIPSATYNMPVMQEEAWEQMVRRLSPQFADPAKVNQLYGGEAGLDAYAIANYGSWKNWALSFPLLGVSHFYIYADRQTSPILEQYTAPTSPAEWAKVTEQLNGEFGRDHVFALNHLAYKGRVDSTWPRNVDWTKVNSIEGFYMRSANFSGSNMDGTLLNTTLRSLVKDNPRSPAFWATNLAGLNLTGFDLTDRAFMGVNFSNTQGLTGADFTKTRSMSATNLSNLDMAGFSGDGKVLLRVNFSGTQNLTPQALARATHLNGINLKGTGITRTALEQALTTAGTNFTGNPWINLDSITFDSVNLAPAPVPSPVANASGGGNQWMESK